MNRDAEPPGELPERPLLVYADGELFGDFRTKTAADQALAEAAAEGADVTTSHWDPDRWAGPGWTEPEAGQ